MGRYLVRRVGLAFPTIGAIVVICFALIHLAPGNPVTAMAGDGGDAAYYADMSHRYGFDRPLVRQFFSWLGRIVHGDLGRSYVQGRPVRSLIAERVPATLLLAGTALVLSTLIGIGLGMLAASRPGRARDLVVSMSSVLLFALPTFWLGQLLILGVALRLGWFPVQGMTDARAGFTGWRAVTDVIHHLALPVFVLGGQEIAAVSRLLRGGLITELGSDHVTMARSKGLPERAVYRTHALRRPLLPIVAVISGRVGQLLSGVVVVEIVFGWPGMGRLVLTAMQNRDAPIVLGVFLLTSVAVIAANFAADLLSMLIDPRIRYGGRAAAIR